MLVSCLRELTDPELLRLAFRDGTSRGQTGQGGYGQENVGQIHGVFLNKYNN